MSAQKKILDSEGLRNRLKLKSIQSERKLLESHSAAGKVFGQLNLRPGKIRDHATRLLTSGALAGSLLISSHTATPSAAVVKNPPAVVITKQTQQDLVNMLGSVLPKEIQPLTDDQEKKVSEILRKVYGINAVASLEGNKLNDDYGRMGAEQHLPRWPGDTAEAHGDYIDKGIAPGLGGWGYVPSDVEKYYVAVQTLYLPNWNTDTARLAKWYKYRKVAVVNPANGKVVIGAVADAGPSIWTGKKFGGSPEVMANLEINYGMQNHPVVLFFLDDPDNKVPLGPLEYNVDAQIKALAEQS